MFRKLIETDASLVTQKKTFHITNKQSATKLKYKPDFFQDMLRNKSKFWKVVNGSGNCITRRETQYQKRTFIFMSLLGPIYTE